MFGGVSIWYILPALVGSLVGIGGLISAYLTARRTTSGNVTTSNASEIWRENQQLRDFLKSQVTELSSKVLAIQEREEECKKENAELREKIDKLEHEMRILKNKLADAGNADIQ